MAIVCGDRQRAKARGSRERVGVAEKLVASQMNVMQAGTRQTTLKVEMETTPTRKKKMRKEMFAAEVCG